MPQLTNLPSLCNHPAAGAFSTTTCQDAGQHDYARLILHDALSRMCMLQVLSRGPAALQSMVTLCKPCCLNAQLQSPGRARGATALLYMHARTSAGVVPPRRTCVYTRRSLNQEGVSSCSKQDEQHSHVHGRASFTAVHQRLEGTRGALHLAKYIENVQRYGNISSRAGILCRNAFDTRSKRCICATSSLQA